MVEGVGDLGNIQRKARAYRAEKIQIYFKLRIVGLRHELVNKTVGHDRNAGAAILTDFQTSHNLTCFPLCKIHSHFKQVHYIIRPLKKEPSFC